ncbi:MAG: hypothetical protein CVU65_16535 [Deltaproteobacteria bacterium HGW-Deltaproteobacteria-22]|nr:MAG: hypothetical protein CVU65_16535 [Deltaproteobacteria bacterium HGW-Deltaproteobacteria-22]
MHLVSHLLLFIFFLTAFPYTSWSRCPPQSRAWVKLEPAVLSTRADHLRTFARPCTAVLDRVGDHYLVSAPPAAFQEWEYQGFRFVHIGAEPVPPPAIRWNEIGPRLVDLVISNPGMTRLHRLGFTTTGLPLFALEITDAPGESTAKPIVRLTGAHHGNETVSTDIVFGIAAFLVSPEAQPLRTTFSFWLFPVVNPEGFEVRDRYNDSGADLNRDYGLYWADDTAPFSQPETRAQLSFSFHHPPVLSLDYHSEAEYVNTVYDGSSVTPPEINTVLEFGEVYAQPASLEVIVGYEWYAAYGSCQDFLHGTLGALAYTIETLAPSNTTSIVSANVGALQDILAHLQDRMVCGRVTDTSGRPLRARLQVTAQPQPFLTTASGTFCHVTDADPIQWVVDAPLFGRGTFSMPAASIPDPLEFQLAPSTASFGAFRIVSAGDLGSVANTVNPAYQALGTPDGRTFVLGRDGFVVLDTGLPLRNGAGAELTVVFDPARQGARVSASVSDEPAGTFAACGDYTGDFDLDLSTCGVTTARYIRLANLLQNPQAALDGLLISPSSVPTAVDDDSDGVTADLDCDDSRPEVGPGFEELCDAIDNDCNGLVDEGYPVAADGLIDCTAPDAGPDADGSFPDADADVPDIDTDAPDPDGDADQPKVQDGVSCACRHSGSGPHPGPFLVLFAIGVLLLRRKIL